MATKAVKKKTTKKNQYAKKAAKQGIMEQLNEGLDTKGNVKNTLLETGTYLLISVVGGGLIGAMIGKPSFIAGLAVSSIGHFTGNRLAALTGLGMMASNGLVGSKSVNGLEGVDGIKERVMAFKEDLLDKTYLNKLRSIGGGSAKAAAKQVGELQYFNYGNEMNGHNAALASIENQLLESGMQFHDANNAAFAQQGEDIELDEERLY
jgi:hypothetical protein